MVPKRLSVFLAAIAISLTLYLVGTDSIRANGLENLSEINKALAELSDQISPAVVQVISSSYEPADWGIAYGSKLLSRRRSSGSGLIIDSDGYIITNSHVVVGAIDIQVITPIDPEIKEQRQSILKPRGKTYDAKIVGIDLETDLAVLKIEAENLPNLELADSDKVKKGQIVFAFGSPRGLENSFTMGVVSAVARQLTPEDPMIYIQTDATINPGNSGGPLVNHEGKVVGINTLIYTQSGGSEGIGFAAPSNIVKTVYTQIKEHGRVRRGTIGIYAQTITPILARGLGLDRRWGVIVGDVYPDSPAESAGLKIGDIILALNLKPMENGRQFMVNTYQWEIGDAVKLDILRDGKEMSLAVAVTERSDNPERFAELVTPENNLVPQLGLLLLELDERYESLLPNLRVDYGLIVAARSYDSPRYDGGLFPGDVIYSVNGTPVAGLTGFRGTLSALDEGDAVVMQIDRNGRLMYIAFEMEE